MAKLAAMRYKGYTWPHNPRVYTIDYARKMVGAEVPYGGYMLQDMGLTRRVLRGQGEFVGDGAYKAFSDLASLFYQEGPGMLVHPVWQPANAYFTKLSLRQEPRADYVSYTFEFWEDSGEYGTGLKQITSRVADEGETATGTAAGGGAIWHTVARGETMWGIAKKYGAALERVIGLNPQIKNPNIIMVGAQVRVK